MFHMIKNISNERCLIIGQNVTLNFKSTVYSLQLLFFVFYKTGYTGLSLRGGSWGFPPATMNVVPGYFRRTLEEK